jgi:hypothetical protein
MREECLSEHVFVSFGDPRRKIEQWRIEYNRERPHSSLGNLIPEEFAARAANPGSPALARTGSAKEGTTGRRGAQRDGFGSKTQQLFDHSQGAVTGGPKNYKRN